MGKPGLLDLEKLSAYYGANHTSPMNFLLHLLLVWPNFFTSLVLFHFTPPLLNFPQIGLNNYSLVLNFGFLFALVHALFYVCLDKKAGSLAAFFCLGCWVLSSSFATHLGFSLAWKVAVAAQLFFWTGHYICHGIFEKRVPSLKDNCSQGFFMEPFFVLLEGLQMFFGYEPYPEFYVSVKPKVEAKIKERGAKKETKAY